MPKRSLNPGNGGQNNAGQKKIEQLNKAVDAMLSRANSKPGKVEGGLEPLVRIAADLRNLPSASFKARLKSELEGKKRMSTVAETTLVEPKLPKPTVAKPGAAVRVTAAPRLAFRDPAKAIEFYKRAFGAKEIFRFEVGGSIPHAEIMIGDSSINIAGEWPEGGRFSAETLGNSPIWMSVQVPDVDAFAERAIAAGMTVILPLKDQFYGRRDVTLADPFGYKWTGVQVKEEMSVEEMHRRMQGLTRGPEGGQMPGHEAPKVNPVPRGFRMVTPYLVAADGLALLEFTKQGLGAEEMMRAVMPTGVHAEVRIGDTTLMMGGGIPGKEIPRHAPAECAARLRR